MQRITWCTGDHERHEDRDDMLVLRRIESAGVQEINDDTRIIEMKNVSNEGLLVFINE